MVYVGFKKTHHSLLSKKQRKCDLSIKICLRYFLWQDAKSMHVTFINVCLVKLSLQVWNKRLKNSWPALNPIFFAKSLFGAKKLHFSKGLSYINYNWSQNQDIDIFGILFKSYIKSVLYKLFMQSCTMHKIIIHAQQQTLMHPPKNAICACFYNH